MTLAFAPSPARPLLVTDDPLLLDDALRVAALAGVALDVAASAAAARAGWSAAPLVVVGSDLAPSCAASGLTRRPGVVLLGADLDDGSVWQTAVAVGAEHVVFLPDAEPWLTELLAESVEPTRAGALRVGILGARGGAGATSLAVALAVQAAAGGIRTWLVDGDPLGAGIDLVLGGEHAPGVRWPDLEQARGRLGAGALDDALPLLHGVRVLSCARDAAEPVPDAVPAVLGAARRSADLVLVDLPRPSGPWADALLAELDTVVLVVPCELRATAAAGHLADRLRAAGVSLLLVTRGPSPAGLAPAEVARVVGAPVFVAMRQQPGLDRLLERGEPPGQGRGPLASACVALLDALLPERRAA